MAIAYWMVHAPQSPFPLVSQGEGAVLYCFVFLYFAAVGGGTMERGRGVAQEGLVATARVLFDADGARVGDVRIHKPLRRKRVTTDTVRRSSHA